MKERGCMPFDRIGRELSERVEKARELEIVQNRENPHFFPFGIADQEYYEAQELKQRLLQEYEGTHFEDVVDGEEFKTETGTCYRIKTCEEINLRFINQNRAREKILKNLKLIYGIGEVTEHCLKAEGYKTIEDLVDHPRFGTEAAKFLEINMCDTYQLTTWIGHWLPKSHPLILYSSSFHSAEDFILLDIESMGLFSSPIILCGVAQISGSQLLVNQYLLRDIAEEPGALSGFLSHTDETKIFVTFNGKAFDIPYIKERLAYYRMSSNLQNPHFDLLHFSRRAFRKKVPDCRLTTLEGFLFGVKRINDVPSALVPDFYHTYVRTGNVGPLIPIIEHNRQDLITSARIFSRLHEEWK